MEHSATILRGRKGEGQTLLDQPAEELCIANVHRLQSILKLVLHDERVPSDANLKDSDFQKEEWTLVAGI